MVLEDIEMINIILAVIILAVAGLALFYIIKSKKNGVKCIGCPSAGACKAAAVDQEHCECGCVEETQN